MTAIYNLYNTMKIKYILIALLSLSSINSFSQLHYKKLINSDCGVGPGSGLIQNNDSSFLVGCSLLFTSFAIDGSHSWSRKIRGFGSSLNGANSCCKLAGIGFAFVSTDTNYCPGLFLGSHPELTILDSNGQTLLSKKILLQNYCSNFSLSVSSFRNKILITGLAQTNINYFPFIGQIDNSGVLDNLKIYNGIPNGNPLRAFRTGSNDVILGVNFYPQGSGLMKLDSMLNIIWCKIYLGTQGSLNSVIENADGTYTLSGSRDTMNHMVNLFLLKVDISGSVIWGKEYGSHLFSDVGGIIRTSDGGFLLSASGMDSSLNSQLILIKTDQNGDTLWTRCHGGNSNEYAGSVIQLINGDYVVGGSSDSPPGGIYLIRTDSLGWAGCQEEYYPITVNPIFPTDSNWVQTFDTGAVVMNSNLTDTTFTISVFDGCLLDNVHPITGIDKSKLIYPNPTSGKINFKRNEPVKQPSFVTVYNSTGKVIFEKHLTSEQNQQLDLSRSGKGIYLIKFTEGEKITTSRVVIE